MYTFYINTSKRVFLWFVADLECRCLVGGLGVLPKDNYIFFFNIKIVILHLTIVIFLYIIWKS